MKAEGAPINPTVSHTLQLLACGDREDICNAANLRREVRLHVAVIV